MMLRFQLSVFCIVCFVSACQEVDSKKASNFQLMEITVPSTESGEANLFVTEKGQTYLSWVEYLNDTTDALWFSELNHQQWSAPSQIAQGSDWFVNWADFPSLVASADGQHLAAHWLAKRSAGTYDYDVHIAQSTDGGKHWSPSFIPHRDSISAEHGFVTMLPLSDGQFFATWLDGRNTKTVTEDDHTEHHHGHGGGAMTLRSAIFDQKNNLSQETELDQRICDCCQTDAAMTDAGLVVVYRDRLEPEIRDISIVRQVNGEWTSPQVVHPDQWTIAGCPVNGPAIAANGHQLVVAWYTMYGKQALVKVAFSEDAGATFGEPIRIDNGNPLGRVDVVFDKNENAVVTWLESVEKAGEIRSISIDKNGHKSNSQILLKTDAARKSGFPILERVGEELLIAWTAVEGEKTVVKTAWLK